MHNNLGAQKAKLLSLKIENKINNFRTLSENKNKRMGEKTQISRIADEILISELQDFEQYHKLNPTILKQTIIKQYHHYQNTEIIISRLHHCYYVLHLIKQPT